MGLGWNEHSHSPEPSQKTQPTSGEKWHCVVRTPQGLSLCLEVAFCSSQFCRGEEGVWHPLGTIPREGNPCIWGHQGLKVPAALWGGGASVLDFLVSPGCAPCLIRPTSPYAPPHDNRASSDRWPCSYPPSLPRITGTDWLLEGHLTVYRTGNRS